MKQIVSLFLTALMLLSLGGFLPKENAACEPQSGKITSELMDALEASTERDELPVYVILSDIDKEDVKKSFFEKYPEAAQVYYLADEGIGLSTDFPNGDSLQRAIDLKREIYAEAYKTRNQAFADSVTEKSSQLFISRLSPMLILNLNRAQIEALALDENVCKLDFFENLDWHNSLVVANSNSGAAYVRDVAGYDGYKIRIGQLEDGVPEDNADLTTVIKSSSDPQSSHATLVALIMVGQTNGIAPRATLYSKAITNLLEFYTEAESLITDDKVNIINVSGVFGTDGKYVTSSKWVDHIAKEHDVHMVLAAGNHKSSNTEYYISNIGMAYNAFTIGGFNDFNLGINNSSSFQISSFSLYQEFYNTNRPEKPNLVASANSINYPGFGSNSGTSFATPQVSGVIAQMCQRDTMLRTRQSIMGALLAAGAVAIDQSNDPLIANTQQIREKQGAGMLNARNMLEIIDSGIYLRYKRAAENFPITKTVSISTLQQTTVRAAIFWLKQNSLSGNHSSGFSINEEPLSNLDLKIYDPNGTAIALSTTQYSNYEIVEFSPTVSGTYTIKITRSASATAAEEIVGLAFIQSVD